MRRAKVKILPDIPAISQKLAYKKYNYWGQDPDLPEELAWIYDYDGGEKDLATDAAIDSEMKIMEFIKFVNNSDNFS